MHYLAILPPICTKRCRKVTVPLSYISHHHRILFKHYAKNSRRFLNPSISLIINVISRTKPKIYASKPGVLRLAIGVAFVVEPVRLFSALVSSSLAYPHIVKLLNNLFHRKEANAFVIISFALVR